MAYAPDKLNEPPIVDKDYDPAAEPTPDNPNVFKLAVEQAEAQAAAHQAANTANTTTTYNYAKEPA